MKNNTHSKITQHQREKPKGFSLCFFMVFLMLATPACLTAQPINQSRINAVLNGNFTDIQQLPVSEQSPEHQPPCSTTDILGYTLQAILKGRPAYCNDALRMSNEALQNEHTTAYTRIFAHTSKTVVNGYKGAYIAAVINFLSGYRELRGYISRNNEIPAEIAEIIKIYNGVLHQIPSKYIDLLAITGIEPLKINNDKRKHNSLAREPARTIYIFRKNILEKQSASEITAQNKIAVLIKAIYYIKNKKPAKAIEKLQTIESYRSHIVLHYYYLGVAYLNSGQYEQASQHLNQFLLMREKGSLIKSALLRQKWIAVIQGKPADAYAEIIKKRGTTYTFTDQQAMKARDIQYHPALLEARVLYDGGCFEKAENVLKEIDADKLKPAGLTTYYYRKGRILQAQKQLQAAIEAYNALQHTPNSGHYYHKKAILETGRIYMKLGRKKKAVNCFNKVNEVYSRMYINVINQEAERLKNKCEKALQMSDD